MPELHQAPLPQAAPGAFRHHSVMLPEAVAALAPAGEGIYVDATFGSGGHSRAILDALGTGGRLLALDRDPEAIARGEALLACHPERLALIHGAFGDFSQWLARAGVAEVDGVIFDLGLSSPQLDNPARGFSFQTDGPLDMRMDNSNNGQKRPTAAHLVNTLEPEALEHIFFYLGEERYGRRAARAIVRARSQNAITTTRQLAQLLERVIPSKTRRIHPGTRVFQALRMAVNGELEELQRGLASAMDRLKPGGRIVVISFHSLEDRLVKQAFRRAAFPQVAVSGPARLVQPGPETVHFRLPHRKALLPQAEEVGQNPRSRSAKMRVIERLRGVGAPPLLGAGVS